MKNVKNLSIETLKSLQDSFDGEINNQGGINKLVIDSSKGHGEIRCVTFNEGISVIEFEVTLNEDTDFSVDLASSQMINFLYCLKGHCVHRFEKDDKIIRIDELQTAVAFSYRECLNIITLKKDVPIVFNMVVLDKTSYLENARSIIANTGVDLISLLHSFNSKKGIFLLGRINLEIGELIGFLDKAKFVDDASMLMYFEGICHLIVAKQIEQYRINQELEDLALDNLLVREMKSIVDMIQKIKDEPEEYYSIKSLSDTYGISSAKMQMGFKYLHGYTVGEFIRNERLKKAEFLLRTTDMNVSEVSYSIGLTSRSYFCKIFKGKYACNPKRYKKMIGKLSLIEVDVD